MRESWDKDLSLNLKIPFFMVQELSQKMQRGGKILFTSTASAARGGGANTLAYGVAKAGIETITKNLAKSLGPKGIMVNCISPGFIHTRFQENTAKKTPKMIDQRKNLIPLGRAGMPDDVANSILYLISEENRFVTGECLKIDGGDFL